MMLKKKLVLFIRFNGVLLGYINGYDDNTFRPEENITREEAAVIISRAVSLSNDGMEFEDKEKSRLGQRTPFQNRRKQNNAGLRWLFRAGSACNKEMTAVVAVRLYEKF